jgi:hypothetical protein
VARQRDAAERGARHGEQQRSAEREPTLTQVHAFPTLLSKEYRVCQEKNRP